MGEFYLARDIFYDNSHVICSTVWQKSRRTITALLLWHRKQVSGHLELIHALPFFPFLLAFINKEKEDTRIYQTADFFISFVSLYSVAAGNNQETVLFVHCNGEGEDSSGSTESNMNGATRPSTSRVVVDPQFIKQSMYGVVDGWFHDSGGICVGHQEFTSRVMASSMADSRDSSLILHGTNPSLT